MDPKAEAPRLDTNITSNSDTFLGIRYVFKVRCGCFLWMNKHEPPECEATTDLEELDRKRGYR